MHNNECPDCKEPMSVEVKTYLNVVNTGGNTDNQLFIENVTHLFCENHGYYFIESEEIDKIEKYVRESGLKHVFGGGITYNDNSEFAELVDYIQYKQAYGGGINIIVDLKKILHVL